MKARYKSGSGLKTKTVPKDNLPRLDPCPTMVKIPQLASEYTLVMPSKTKQKQVTSSLLEPFDNTTAPVEDRYIKKISADLRFSEEVVKEKCFHMLPYDDKYFWEALDIGDLIVKPPATICGGGRHNNRGPDVRHAPCLVTKGKTSLKPLKSDIVKKAILLHQQAVKKQKEIEDDKSVESDAKKQQITEEDASEQKEKESGSVFMTEVSYDGKEKDKKSPSPRSMRDMLSDKMAASQKNWDAYLLSIMSPLTAKWVVHKKMPPSEDRENLSQVLAEWYGPSTDVDLVPDNISECEFELETKKKKKEKPQKKKDKTKMTFLEKVKAEYQGTAHDPYSIDNDAPFYRQPAGVRRQYKTVEKEEAGSINTTAHNIEVKTYKPPPLPTLEDYLNPAVGNTMYRTDNRFQQEWLTGCKQVYQPDDESKIVMESQTTFKKQFRKEYPDVPEHWFPESEVKKEQPVQQRGRRITTIKKGYRRWKALPEPMDDTSDIVNVAPPGYDPEFHRSPDPKTRRVIKLNTSLMQIINEWRAKWHLSGQFADSNSEDLIRDMTDIQPHVRLKAIVTAGKAAEYKPPEEQGITLEYEERGASNVDEKIIMGLQCLLDDRNETVKKTAAITLYSLNRPTAKAESILRKTLFAETTIDRWTAAQCLAHFGVCDSDIVGEIIKQLLSTEDSIKHEQGISLLAKISNNSTLVHCMVAEQLNSSSWRHRVIACKILPTLHGTINKDITHKLSELMWNDWHAEVRKATAQCLGKTQHGREVHNELQHRLEDKNEPIRLEAISRIGQLGIMTAKLLPVFLKCFDDPYMSIRLEMCITSGNLGIKDERVVDKLVNIATYDPVWKVKATAVQALGKIGVTNDRIFECLLWALRYEEKPTVRAEACHSLIVLGYHDDEMIEVLQDRLLVETSQPVRDEMLEALREFGVNTTEDMDMVAQIKKEVRKLCTRNIIATQIMMDETDELTRENMERLICESDKELEAHKAKVENFYEQMRAMSARSSLRSGIIKTENDLGSPEPSRESTIFTPSADKELEDIMSREDTTETDSPDTVTLSSMGTKSRTVSGKSMSSSATKSRNGISIQMSSEKSEGDSSSAGKSRTGDTNQNTSTKGPLKTSSVIPMLEVSEVRTTSSVSSLPGMPSHTGAGMTPSVSTEDVSRLSRMSMGRTSERKALLSRDTQIEKDKISASSVRAYLGLNARYTDMLPLLDKLDYGLSALDTSSKSSPAATIEDKSAVGESLDSTASSTQDEDTGDISTKSVEDVQSQLADGVKCESIDGKTSLSTEKDAAQSIIPSIEIEGQQNGELSAIGDNVPAIIIDTASEVDHTESSIADDVQGGTSMATDKVEHSKSEDI
ncbi:HEAT repeat-containing protein 4-like isoform X2 [Gigantopelta aegis]|uniref:HEAT repeat-containing protein 4-like isoform X2 n=1 Tax=Gigantopelta aegis TaxID=1735272 RepID=UPI001B88DEBF|nr:HEAT repeat-containing protein 4-like isoform X2 [Gigantopelta aegis]